MFEDRARGAFLGLALGDAYGRSLEFLSGHRVRSQKVEIPSPAFMWTDDTHMSLYLVDAFEALGTEALSRFSAEDFGRAVGEAFVRWSQDPLTPSTAPGNTCLEGSRRFARTGDWHTSGVRESDGCGAVMRVVPLPIVLSGTPLITAARVQSVVTHAHENAPASAIAASLLLRELLEGAPLNVELVLRTLRRLDSIGKATPSLVGALTAAVGQAQRSYLPWLDEAAIPDGDGGWRSPSALGLALVAALRWRDDPALAMEKAARIDGDSDSVACLTGMFLGAVHGVAGLPEAWLAALPERSTIESAVDRLLALRPTLPDEAQPAPNRPRTSESHPIEVAWLPVPVGSRGGRIGLTFAPGKQAPSTLGRPWQRTLSTDLNRLRDHHRTDVLVSLVEDEELQWMRIPDLVAEAENRGIAVLRHPVPDGRIPEPSAADATVQAAVSLAKSGRCVVFHCRGGLGRAGTFAALTLRALGMPGAEAMRVVRKARPGAIENRVQELFVTEGP